MIALDVQYAELAGGAEHGYTAAVGFDRWTDAHPNWTHARRHGPVAPYRAGHFFERELPCLLSVLAPLEALPAILVVDGYASLPDGRPGLGAHLREALAERGGSPIVVGVSKTHFHGDVDSVELRRGESDRPLFITAVGTDPATAADWVASMHGAHRMPTLLGLADRVARDAARDDEP